jgi:alkaline phosphatase
MNTYRQITILFVLISLCPLFCDVNDTSVQSGASSTYSGGESYVVKAPPSLPLEGTPKNVILLIGDGTGLAQIYAAYTANHGSLYLTCMPVTGFSVTNASSDFVTDSAAGATALACGSKTYNAAIGVDTNKKNIPSICELLHPLGKSSGLVVACAITHATPACFYAHQPQRSLYEDIAADLLNAPIDLFIGGGRDHFENRKDKRNLTKEFLAHGIAMYDNLDSLMTAPAGRAGVLVCDMHPKPAPERGDYLPRATRLAIKRLSTNPKGFFLMVEGSQVDWACHANNTPWAVSEILDFDRTVAEALAYAANDKQTLVVVTADHETGGLSLLGGNFDNGQVRCHFSTKNHSGIPVPIYAYGPGAIHFTGFMQNSELGARLLELASHIESRASSH